MAIIIHLQLYKLEFLMGIIATLFAYEAHLK